MTQDERDLAWSTHIAGWIADELVYERVIKAEQLDTAAAVIARQIYVTLAGGSRPETFRAAQP